MAPTSGDVRSGVHEYGGGAWWVADGVLVHVDRSDERLVRREPGRPDVEPMVLTPPSDLPRGLRYADGRITPDGQWSICVRESHVDGGAEPANELVAVAMDGSWRVEVLVSGPDFVSNPRVSPDGQHLVWIQWNHPDLPWDDTTLWVGDLSAAGHLTGQRRVMAMTQASRSSSRSGGTTGYFTWLPTGTVGGIYTGRTHRPRTLNA